MKAEQFNQKEPAGEPVKEPTPLTPEEEKKLEKKKQIERAKRQAQEYIDHNRNLFTTLAGDNTMSFKVGNGFQIDYEKGEISLGYRDWLDNEAGALPSTESFLFGSGHEIGHLRDLMDDPEGLLRNFDRMIRVSKDNYPRALDILQKRAASEGKPLPKWLTEDNPLDDKPNGEKIKGLALFLYKKVHMLYNCLDDINVNKRQGRVIPRFQIDQGKHSPVANEIYRDYLFPAGERGEKTDDSKPFSALSHGKHAQLAYYFLRKRMVPNQDVLVDPGVKVFVDSKVGNKSMFELVDEITRPTLPQEKRQHIASFRHAIIEKIVEPEFWRFLFDDLEKLPFPNKPKKGQDSGEEGDGEGSDSLPSDSDEKSKSDDDKKTESDSEPKNENDDPWKDINEPSPIDREAVKDFIRAKKDAEKKKRKEAYDAERLKRMNPEEKAKYLQRKKDEMFASEYGGKFKDPAFADLVMADYRYIQRQVEGYKKDIAKIWEEILVNLKQELETEWHRYYSKGKLDIGHFVKKYGHLLQDGAIHELPDEVISYAKKGFIEKIKFKPDEIRFRFLIDISGSMIGDNIEAVKALYVAFMESLAEFERGIDKLFKSFKCKKPPIRINTQVIVWGDAKDAKIVKPFKSPESGVDPQRDFLDTVAAFSYVNADSGGTEDAPALQLVMDSFDEQKDSERVEKGELIDVGFELTDGGTQTLQQSRNYLEKLKSMNMIMKALQIVTIEEQKQASNEPDEEESGPRIKDDKPKDRPFDPVEDSEKFQRLWGEDGRQIFSVAELGETVLALFREEIKKIKLKIEKQQ